MNATDSKLRVNVNRIRKPLVALSDGVANYGSRDLSVTCVHTLGCTDKAVGPSDIVELLLLSVNQFFFFVNNLDEYFSFHLLEMICSRCAKRVQTRTVQLDLRSLNIQGDVCRVDCIDGDHLVAVTLKNKVIDVDDTYDDRLEDGWRQVQTDRDKVLFHVLSQIVYPNFDTPRPEKFESLYAPVDEHDLVLLRWHGGKAVGFYTVKPTGTEVFSTKERYTMPVVDTAYIRSEYRNRGFGTEILSDVIKRFPNEDIGFSKPISSGMLKILKTFLSSHKEHRLRFWEIADCDIGGSQQLIWCRLKRSSLMTKSN